jgi:Domain of unknown function (DUF4442)
MPTRYRFPAAASTTEPGLQTRERAHAIMNPFFKRHIRSLINFWPPFLGAGIRVTRWDPDWRAVDVSLPMRRWNANFVGTHYGGSLYSMVDPFYMLMLIENLGPEYVVWDKAAQIRFRRPGKGRVTANFRLSQAQIDDIRAALQTADKLEPSFPVEIRSDSGELVAEVQKLLHIKKRSPG